MMRKWQKVRSAPAALAEYTGYTLTLCRLDDGTGIFWSVLLDAPFARRRWGYETEQEAVDDFDAVTTS